METIEENDFFQYLLSYNIEELEIIAQKGYILCIPQNISLPLSSSFTPEFLCSHILSRLTPGIYTSMLQHSSRYIQIKENCITIFKTRFEPWETSQCRMDTKLDSIRILYSEKLQIERIVKPLQILVLQRPLYELNEEKSGEMMINKDIPWEMDEMNEIMIQKYIALLVASVGNEIYFSDIQERLGQLRILVDENAENKESAIEEIAREMKAIWQYSVAMMYSSLSMERTRMTKKRCEELMKIRLENTMEAYLLKQKYKEISSALSICYREKQQKLEKRLEELIDTTPFYFGIPPKKQFDLHDAISFLLESLWCQEPVCIAICWRNCIESVRKSVYEAMLDEDQVDGASSIEDISTDDILDSLLFVITEAYKRQKRCLNVTAHIGSNSTVVFPLIIVCEYVNHFHFVTSSRSTIGYAIASIGVVTQLLLKDDFKVIMKKKSTAVMTSLSDYDSIAYEGSNSTNQNKAQASRRRRKSIADLTQMEAEGNLYIVEKCKRYAHIQPSQSNIRVRRMINERYRQICLLDDGRMYTLAAKRSRASLEGNQRVAKNATKTSSIAEGEQKHENLVSIYEYVPLQSTVSQVACGKAHTLLTTTDGYVYSTGNNKSGQLGYDTPNIEGVSHLKLIDRFRGTYISKISAGDEFSVAVSAVGVLYSWGLNSRYQLGRSTDSEYNSKPENVDLLESALCYTCMQDQDQMAKQLRDSIFIKALVCGSRHTLALTMNGDVFSWGGGSHGQLGHGFFGVLKQPKRINLNIPIKRINAWQNYSVLITASDQVLFSGDFDDITTCSFYATDTNDISAVECATNSIAFLTSNGDILGWESDRSCDISMEKLSVEMIQESNHLVLGCTPTVSTSVENMAFTYSTNF